MEQLIERIQEVLASRNARFKDLADHLGIDEQSLREAFEKNTIEIRTMEKISKELKIPLYRFFRDPVGNLLESIKENQPYAMISNEELMNLKIQLDIAQQEIRMLKQELEARESIIDELRTKIKG